MSQPHRRLLRPLVLHPGSADHASWAGVAAVVLEGQGHLANLRAPGEVAEVIAAFADRLAP